MIRTQSFGEMIRVSVQKSEIQRKSQSYSPKVRVTAGWTPQSESNCPKQVSESDFDSSAEKGLKALLNPPNTYRCCFGVWTCFRQVLQETLQHGALGGIFHCHAMIGAVLPRKSRGCRLQFTVFVSVLWGGITIEKMDYIFHSRK